MVSTPDRTLAALTGLAVLVLVANLGLLIWLYQTPPVDTRRAPQFDLGPGEQVQPS